MDKSLFPPPFIQDLFQLFFPKICAVCDCPLIHQEQFLCISCLIKLPKLRLYHLPDNQAARRLWGKFHFDHVSAFLELEQKSISGKLIKQIKYKHTARICSYLAYLYASELKRLQVLQAVDLIIPIPLSKRKMAKRGYNQSEFIAQGIASVYQLPVAEQLLQRNEAPYSQTKLGRIARFDELKDVFYIKSSIPKPCQHILLVDDVITTGATITAASNYLRKRFDGKISVCSLFLA